ncbi:hypothetical protein BDN72DRAFT_739365, partial [Pluteus cervinus]
CLVGTRTEVLLQIQNWTKAIGSQLFWLHGQAGTGKSAIAQSVFNWSKAQNECTLLYTCSKTQAELQNPLNVLPTLCSQFCAMNEEYAKHIVDQLQNDPLLKGGQGHITTQLEMLFIRPFQYMTMSGEHVYLVILDALDEC